MGLVLGEIAAFVGVAIVLKHVYKILEFKYKVMVREDKEAFFAKHNLTEELNGDDQ